MTDWLTQIGRELVDVHTEAGVSRATATVVKDRLDADAVAVAVAEDDRLRVTASTPRVDDWGPSEFPLWNGIPGTVYARGEPCVIDDLADVRNGAAACSPDPESTKTNDQPAIRSLIVVPIGEIGVIIAASVETSAFTETDSERIGDLVRIAMGALDATHTTRDRDGDRLDEVTSILSHDIQSPLQVARGRLQMAEESGDQGHLDEVASALDRIEAIVDDLLMLARTDQRVGPMAPITVDDLVHQAWSTVETSTATLDVEDTQTILADESTACQLFENLFSNAIEHAGRDVVIRVGPLESGVYIEDDGPGIPSDRREDVFEWRVSGGSEHAGLGLAIVDRIAQAHGWGVSVTEGNEGGARFELTDIEIVED